ncbi:MAG: peptidoglycan DD-metalloendopeptidase family protein [Actinomycetota bacterium]|nr:peptidoglycan DD-metalloendopeptidase family protein [Actinomycetota bacterium]
MRGLSVKSVLSSALVAGLIVLLSLLPMAASSATLEEKQREAQEVRRQIEALKAESQRLAEEYNAALSEYESIRYEVELNREQLEAAQRDYKKARTILNDRLRTIYKTGDINSLEVLLDSSSIDDLLTRYDFFTYIGNRDIQVFDEVKRLKEEISQKQWELEEKEARSRQVVATVNANRFAMEASLEEQQKFLDGINEEIKQLLAEQGTGGSVSVGSFVFPVNGPHTFTNDWHAPRTGHLHQGNDIFAAEGTPCVACASGTVHHGEGKNAGLYVRLVADDGNVYYYMHLQRFAATGHVAAGTVIGYVGDTGNAEGGPPHLHFEVHPGGGAAVNPYPLLVASDN